MMSGTVGRTVIQVEKDIGRSENKRQVAKACALFLTPHLAAVQLNSPETF